MSAAGVTGGRGSVHELLNLTGIEIERCDFGRLRGRGPNREQDVFSTGEDFRPAVPELTVTVIWALLGLRVDRLRPERATIRRRHSRK